MSEQDCAQILVRTNYIDEWQTRRKQIKEFYLEQFSLLPIKCLSRGINHHADQKFVLYTDRRDELKSYLSRKGIEAKIHYNQSLSDLPISRYLVKPDLLSMSSMLVKGVLSLPIYPELTDAEVEFISNSVKKFYA